jgi:endonuclease/exonuclease/phosphatase (EEP) superfamily protein YafD
VRAGASPLLTVPFALLALASVLALWAPLGWPFELFSHFRPQYAASALLLAMLFGWRRSPRWAFAALALGAWHGLPVVQRALADAPAASSCSAAELGVVTANLQYANGRPAPFLEWLAAQPADLVVVQELSPGWATALEALPRYPYRHFIVRSDAYGIGVLSRWPLEQVEAVDLGRDGRPSLSGVAVVGGQRVRFYGMHARWPMLPALARSRDEALARLAALVRSDDLPVVVLGDLNLSPDSPAFARLLGASGLRDALQGPHWRPTWMAGFWPLALRIDHVLVNDGLCVEGTAVGGAIGSDHRPVSARLRLRAPAAAVAAGAGA